MKHYLAGNTSGDYDNLDPIKSLLEFVCRVTIDLVPRHSVGAGRTRRGTLTSPGVSMWLTSAATPGAPRMSYRLREVTRGSALSKRERGWPIPPPAPRTATLVWRAADEENQRPWAGRLREAYLASIFRVLERWKKRTRDGGPGRNASNRDLFRHLLSHA